MTKFFMYGTQLQDLEQLMMLVPNFTPRTSGMLIVKEYGIKKNNGACFLCSYTRNQYLKEEERKMTHLQLAGEIFQNVGNKKLDERMIRLKEKFEGEVFETNEHVHNFYQECARRKINFDNCSKNFIAVIYLFTSTDERLDRYYKCLLKEEMDLDKADLTKICVSDYAIYQAAKTIYTERTSIYVDELVDENLIDDETFVLITNSFLIARHGAKILRMVR